MDDLEKPSPAPQLATDPQPITLTPKQVRMLKMVMSFAVFSASQPEAEAFESLEAAGAAVEALFNEVISPSNVPQMPTAAVRH